MVKRCSKCGQLKDYSEFYKNRALKDGLQPCCKKCDKIRRKKYKTNNKYKKRPKEVWRRRYYRIKRNPIGWKRKLAGWQIKYALKTGKIKKQPCKICGKLKVEAHHFDYDKPLKVWWLCRKHHRLIHQIMNELIKLTNLKKPWIQ